MHRGTRKKDILYESKRGGAGGLTASSGCLPLAVVCVSATPSISRNTGRTSSCGVLQQLRVDMLSRELHVPYDGAAYEAVPHRHLEMSAQGRAVRSRCGRTTKGSAYHVRVSCLVQHLDRVESYVQKPVTWSRDGQSGVRNTARGRGCALTGPQT